MLVYHSVLWSSYWFRNETCDIFFTPMFVLDAYCIFVSGGNYLSIIACSILIIDRVLASLLSHLYLTVLVSLYLALILLIAMHWCIVHNSTSKIIKLLEPSCNVTSCNLLFSVSIANLFNNVFLSAGS